MASIPWHTKPETTKILNEYHDRKAKQPNEAIKNTKAAFNELLRNLESHLQNKGIVERVENVGSCYSNVRVDVPIEYDVIMVLKNGEFLQKRICPAHPGFVYLDLKDKDHRLKFESAYFDKATNSNSISSFLVKNKFISLIEQWLKEVKANTQLMQKHSLSRFIHRDHGAAVQVDVFNTKDELLFNVDLVPAFELSHVTPREDRELFVAKQYNPNSASTPDSKLSWRRSYSVKDKVVLDNIDKGSLIHKNVLRIMKAMLKGKSDLAKIKSYHVKTAMLKVDGECNNPAEWTRDKLAARFFAVLDKLRRAMQDGILYDYFASQNQQNPDMVNLIADIEQTTRLQIASVLGGLHDNEKRFIDCFQLP